MKAPGVRELVVIFAGLVIVVVCTWRMLTPRDQAGENARSVSDRRPAPAFELYDQNSRLVNLEALLHRHRIVLVFQGDGEKLESSALLKQLRDYYPTLERNGVRVLAVSSALPQTIRADVKIPFPFPILSDVTAGQPGSASVLWGTAVAPVPRTAVPSSGPSSTSTIRSALFLIDRAGLVDWSGDTPRPATDPLEVVRTLVTGG